MVKETPIIKNVSMVEKNIDSWQCFDGWRNTNSWKCSNGGRNMNSWNVQKIEKISNCESQKYFLSNWTSYDGITLELIQIHSNFQFIL
jgi:hypothetical protein